MISTFTLIDSKFECFTLNSFLKGTYENFDLFERLREQSSGQKISEDSFQAKVKNILTASKAASWSASFHAITRAGLVEVVRLAIVVVSIFAFTLAVPLPLTRARLFGCGMMGVAIGDITKIYSSLIHLNTEKNFREFDSRASCLSNELKDLPQETVVVVKKV